MAILWHSSATAVTTLLSFLATELLFLPNVEALICLFKLLFTAWVSYFYYVLIFLFLGRPDILQIASTFLLTLFVVYVYLDFSSCLHGMRPVWDLVGYVCHRVTKCINSVLWTCCLATVWCSWALIFRACCHLFRVIYWLQTTVHILTFVSFIIFRFYFFFLLSFVI